jgi:hypothetical protein
MPAQLILVEKRAGPPVDPFADRLLDTTECPIGNDTAPALRNMYPGGSTPPRGEHTRRSNLQQSDAPGLRPIIALKHSSA